MFAKHQGKSDFMVVFVRYFSLYRVAHTHRALYCIIDKERKELHTINSVCGHELLVVASGLQICSC